MSFSVKKYRKIHNELSTILVHVSQWPDQCVKAKCIRPFNPASQHNIPDSDLFIRHYNKQKYNLFNMWMICRETPIKTLCVALIGANFYYHFPLGTWRCCDVESTSSTLIQRRNNVVCPVGWNVRFQTWDKTWHKSARLENRWPPFFVKINQNNFH